MRTTLVDHVCLNIMDKVILLITSLLLALTFNALLPESNGYEPKDADHAKCAFTCTCTDKAEVLVEQGQEQRGDNNRASSRPKIKRKYKSKRKRLEVLLEQLEDQITSIHNDMKKRKSKHTSAL